MLPRAAMLSLAYETRLGSVGIRVRMGVIVAAGTILATSSSGPARLILRKVTSVSIVDLGITLLLLLVRRDGRLESIDERAEA
jgi:hypothetical protein